MTLMDTHVVVMAGGIGSRLWPVSTPERPKQFIDLLGTGKSLIQMTVDRFLPVCDISRFWVVTSRRYVDIVRSQLPGIPSDNILAEPEPRNTAPCIAYACRKISMRHPDANIIVTPADALVTRTDVFAETMREALAFTSAGDRIVTVGISPDRPETGYGYICSSGKETGKVNKVIAFKEKPDRATAIRYLSEGNYFWNAGIFVWSAATIESQMRRYAPSIAAVMDRIATSFYTEAEEEALSRHFHECEKISIDYAVMEKSDSIYVISGDYGWSDLGSWSSVKAHSAADADGNVVLASSAVLSGCRNCIVNVPGEVAVEGLDGYIVAEDGGRIVVCRLQEEQRIKDFSEKLRK
ncbi:MAG: mannose-1-phosphate guanylyltransferase [Bacteroidetes bacterium]|uniref:mannose-1-phosphate guanylyltransferase n=1 Tax=Candidatus Cryptobacteroides intestinigallinarum TaxID=2840767 RepID=A0A9D9N0R4_9BACT|nr:mannose-1-phosphate guanylyltransferase [Candidatus Cryptobacteroides intestinigallinarum]